MIRACLLGGRQCLSGFKLTNILPQTQIINRQIPKYFSTLNNQSFLSKNLTIFQSQPNPNLKFQIFPKLTTQTRTITKFSSKKGKSKSCKAVLKRFYRLSWGIWIRRIAGCHKKLWKKSYKRKARLQKHVMCNASQSYKLDKMVAKFWKKPKFYIEDPYEPYHHREEFSITRRKPRELPY